MSPHEALAWYTPYELCLLYHSYFLEDPTADKHGRGTWSTLQLPWYRNNRKCDTFYKQGDLGECNVSPSLGALWRHRSTVLGSSKGFVDLVQLMRDKGSNTLILLGDSITTQMFDDAYCSSKRAGLVVSQPVRHDKDTTIHFNIKVEPRIQDGGGSGAPFVLRIWNGRIFVEGGIKFPRETLANFIAGIDGAVLGRPVIVFNFGAHFHTQHVLRKIATNIIHDFVAMGSETGNPSRPIFIYREVSATHFPTPNGGYFVDEQEGWGGKDDVEIEELSGAFHSNFFRYTVKSYPSNRGKLLGLVKSDSESLAANTTSYYHQFPILDWNFECIALQNHTQYENQNWRNRVLLSLLSQFDSSGSIIGIVPFFNLTASRPDYKKGPTGDCMHFPISAPMLWAPVWNSVWEFVQVQS